ncbi:MAG: hypothetical protein ABR962_10550 [Candidatus Bathyarchaeia archaeon]|jgi:hypothetical protein
MVKVLEVDGAILNYTISPSLSRKIKIRTWDIRKANHDKFEVI